ncbi:LysM peptidoglycan-binding domain-containing protein [bacterium]|nr:LysM peptidoglycan-binding domain-containing protein [bacterium]
MWKRTMASRAGAASLAILAGIYFCSTNLRAADTPSGNVDQLKFGGEINEDQANFTFTGHIKGGGTNDEEAIYSSRAIASGIARADAITQTIQFEANLVRGKLRELIIAMQGDGDVQKVEGDGVLDWSVRRDREGKRYLVVRVDESKKDVRQLKFQIETRLEIEKLPIRVAPLIFVPINPALHEGLLRFVSTDDVAIKAAESSDLTRIEAADSATLFPNLPGQGKAEPIAFRFFATQPQLTLELSAADPDALRVVFDQFQLTGNVSGDRAAFTLKGVARLKNPKGGELLVLSGGAALTELAPSKSYRIEYRSPEPYVVRAGDTLSGIARNNQFSVHELQIANNLGNGVLQIGQKLVLPRPGFMPGYYLVFDQPGEFPVELKFDARLNEHDGWRSLNFDVAASSLRPVTINGLAAETEFRSTSTSKPDRQGDAFVANLPATGGLTMEWKEARPEAEGRLFYSVESLGEITVSPGLMRQTHLFDFKIMQGEMSRVTLELAGEGEVVRVAGPDVLSWNIEGKGNDRKLIVQLNQSRKTSFALAVYTQTPLGEFPLAMKPIRLRPESAVRFGGYLRVVNDGAVRLEVTTATGLSQISPNQFPQTQALRTLNDQSGVQIFAYRFSDGAYELAVQADNILPELGVSELFVYHVAETEAVIESEMELDIREAPLREFSMLVPAGYAVAQINNAHLSDYYLTKDPTNGPSRLRIVFSAPVSGHEVINLRLEDNRNLQATNWTLPRIQPEQVKSVRGYLGIAADPGLRLTTVSANESMTEVAPSFFPRKVDGLQLSWRLRDGDWNAAVGIERLQLSIQVDALHLFSIGEGIAYGSSVLNYFVSGSPVSTLNFTAPTNYNNVEFVGRDVRGWRQTTPGNYEVSLNSPVFGAYTLLATYDRQFAPQGATLAFAGVQPTGVQSEQGNVIVISDDQFKVEPATVSQGLIALEPAEIPAEQRLLFASPVLASYQYVSRPFNLELKLTALAQGETMDLVVDRASIQSHVSSEGHVLTDLKYLIKSKGNSHLRMTLPVGVELWNSMIDGAKVVPVADGNDTLIPLPQKSDPNDIITLDLKVASKSANARDVGLKLPVIASPVLQTDWQVEPEANHRLVFQDGALKPTNTSVDFTGFEWLRDLFRPSSTGSTQKLLIAFGLLIGGMVLLRWATGGDRQRGDARNLFGLLLGSGCFVLSLLLLLGTTLGTSVASAGGETALTFSTPILDAGTAVAININNLEAGQAPSFIWKLWPLLLALAAWAYQFRFPAGMLRGLLVWVGWIFVFWAALRAPVGGSLVGPALSLFLFFHLMLPAWTAQRRLPHGDDSSTGATTASGATALLLLGLFLMPLNTRAAEPTEQPLVVNRVEQVGRVQNDTLVVQAGMSWSTDAGQWLDFLRQPAVLLNIDYPKDKLKLIESQTDGRTVYRLTALVAGQFEIKFGYQLPLAQDRTDHMVQIPTHSGLVNRLVLEIDNQDVEVSSPQAVSIKRELLKQNGHDLTRAELVLAPSEFSQLSWRPRSRDLSTEAAVYYAEITHLFIPGAGVIEGVHEASIRLAQGQLANLEFVVPGELTITDVQADFVSTWRFDPDTRKLRVQFKSPQAGSFSLRITSQAVAKPLPYQQSLELITASGAANEIGTVGIATGSDTQVEDVSVENLSSINLEDFPRSPIAYAQSLDATVNLRRAFRFSNTGVKLTVSAAAVEPDVRVVSQETLSLAEDRTVLAVNLAVNITRAGIFKLSFPLPDGLEVESLESVVMSHWTELRDGNQRVVTIHLKGKTEGPQTFVLTLTGPGMTGQPQLAVPRVTLREASKQTGQMVVTPELGIRLHVRDRDGATQLDPKQLNIKQAGVLAFRLLQSNWQLNLDVEKVDPSLQVNVLQDVTVKEGQLQVIANMDYQIENAGINSLQLQLPNGAESVVFKGEYITDSIKADAGTNTLAGWTVKLSRRMIGDYKLKVTYKLFGGDETPINLPGLQAGGVTLQRGHLTVRSGGRLEVQLPNLPANLTIADWQSVTPVLRDGVKSEEPNHLFRVIEPAFNLPIVIVRHEAAKLLPARVEKVDLTSTVSTAGEVLTEVQLSLFPGDKRLLHLRLPKGSEFWFAFVNGESALPWQEGDQILIPLEKTSDPNQPAMVEFFYASQKPAKVRGFDYRLPGPEFDLPLQNITWTMNIDDRWNVTKWDDRWQLRSQAVTSAPGRAGLESYLSRATEQRKAKTVQAETLLQKGNDALQRGDQQLARKSYRAALELSQHDAALNEDARVQLQTLKQQQALVGLNFLNRGNIERQLANAPAQQQSQAAAPFQLGEKANYTQQQVKQLIDQTPNEDNAALMKLADRLVKQQDAAVNRAEAIHATLPAEGRSVTFTRALQVDFGSGAGLALGIDLDESDGARAPRFWPLVLVAIGLGVLWLIGGRLIRRETK